MLKNALLATVLAVIPLIAMPVEQARAAALCMLVPGNLLSDCGFEDGSDAWSFTASGGINGIPSHGPAHSGDIEAYVNAYPGYGTISQTVATIPGHLYRVDFWLASNGGNGVVGSSFAAVQGYTQYNPPVPDLYVYVEIAYTVVASDAASTLVIGGSGLTGTFFIDDVSVQDQSVPEPATLGLVLGACTGLAALRRRRSRGWPD